MLLRKNNIASYRINWNNKADNIKEIASELNIGFDSMIFIDDNQRERELIQQAIPDVAVPDFPEQPFLLPVFVQKLTNEYFDVYALTSEDKNKTRTYQENAKRQQYKASFTDMESYLRSLEIKLKIEELNDFNLARFAQMTQKTNQFNLTTKRYSEAEINNFNSQNGLVYGLRVSDRFGEEGITGLMMIKIEGDKGFIDTLLLSCRILGKGIENVFFTIVLLNMKKHGINILEAEYIKTIKNSQVATFYDDMGFTLISCDKGIKKYSFDLSCYNSTVSDIY
jgi:FkbH-like protein